MPSLRLASLIRTDVGDRLRQLVFLVFVLDCVLELLPVEERPVPSAGGEQLFVLPLLDNFSTFQHDNPTGVTNRTDAM